MGNRIRYNTEAARSCMNELSELASALSQVSASLSSIHVGAEAGGNRPHSILCLLSSTGSSFSASTIGECSGALSRAANGLAHYASRLYAATVNAASTLEEVEGEITRMFGGADIPLDFSLDNGSGPEASEVDGSIGSTATGVAAGIGLGATLDRKNHGGAGASWDAKYNWGIYHYGDENLEIDVGHIDAYSSGSAGLFTTNENGDLLLNPHLEWHSGFSGSLFSATGNYSAGNDMLGAKTHFGMEVGSAKVGTEGCISLLDKNGRINPSAKVNLDMEVVALSAEAESSVSVLGMEASAGGDVGFGMGAHLDAGFEDGVFTLDAGAYIGLGGSVHVSIDVGGMVNSVKGACESIFNSLKLW